MRPDKDKPYYTAYDKRYRAVYDQGADHYLYLPEYEDAKIVIKEFVHRFALNNKNVVEFGYGEGLGGLEFAKLGCRYQGYDISPAAIENAKSTLADYKNVYVAVFDIVKESVQTSTYDAGIDIACLHMLVVNGDRTKYLQNAFSSLKPGAAMLFAHEQLVDTEYMGEVKDYEQWSKITGSDYDTPEQRTAVKNGKVIPIWIPRIAARPRTESSYRNELKQIGFKVLEFTKLEYMANILVKNHYKDK